VPDRRPEGLSQEEFVARWHERIEYAQTLPLWRHVRRYSLLEPADPDETGVRGTALEGMLPDGYAGVSSAEFDDVESMLACFADPSFEQVNEKQKELFGETSSDAFPTGRFHIGRKSVLIEKGGSPRVKMFVFLRRVDGLSRPQFLHEWHTFASANFIVHEEITQHLLAYYQYQGLVDSELAAPGFDGAIELGFVEPSSPVPWFEAAAHLAVQQHFYKDDAMIAFLVTETVVYDAARDAALSAQT
jgi:hypothetical protein